MSVVQFGPPKKQKTIFDDYPLVTHKEVNFRFITDPKLNGDVYEWEGLVVKYSFSPDNKPMGLGVFAKTDLKAGLLIPYRGLKLLTTPDLEMSTRYGLIEHDNLIDANPELPECQKDACIAGRINEAPVGLKYNCQFVQICADERIALGEYMVIPPTLAPTTGEFTVTPPAEYTTDEGESYVLLACNIEKDSELYVHYGGDDEDEQEYPRAPVTETSPGFAETLSQLENILNQWPKLVLSRLYRPQENFVMSPSNRLVTISNHGTIHDTSPLGLRINIAYKEKPYRPSPEAPYLVDPVKEEHAYIFFSDGAYYLQNIHGITFVDGEDIGKTARKLQKDMIVSFGHDGNIEAYDGTVKASEKRQDYDYMLMFKISILNGPPKPRKPKANRKDRKR